MSEVALTKTLPLPGYVPNRCPLAVGDLVVPDGDEKGPRMFARITKIRPGGRRARASGCSYADDDMFEFEYIHPRFPGHRRNGWASSRRHLFPISLIGFTSVKEGDEIVLTFDPDAVTLRYKDGVRPYVRHDDCHLRFQPVTSRRARKTKSLNP